MQNENNNKFNPTCFVLTKVTLLGFSATLIGALAMMKFGHEFGAVIIALFGGFFSLVFGDLVSEHSFLMSLNLVRPCARKKCGPVAEFKNANGELERVSLLSQDPQDYIKLM